MHTLKTFVNNVQYQLMSLVSRLLPYVDTSYARITVFFFLIGYIYNKSFLDIRSHMRTFEGFLIVGIGLVLILRRQDLWGDAAGLVVILILALAPVYWRVQGFDTDGFSLIGIFPSSDAYGYFTGAVKIIYGDDILPFAARRPLFVTFLSTILFFTRQNLVLSLVLLAIFVVVAIMLLVSEVKNSFGVPPAALVATIMIYCYSGRFTGKFLTEQLGIPLGVLSLSILLKGIRQNSFKYVVWGVFVLAIALNARAGAMFVLPLLIVWGVLWAWKSKQSIYKFFLLCGVVGLGFLINYLIFKSIAAPGSVPFANFGSTLYGIATGYKGWRAWSQDYPGLPEIQAFSISLAIIKKSPGLFLTGIFRAYQEFLRPQYFFSFLYLPKSQLMLASDFLLILTNVGIWRLIKNIHLRYSQLMLFVLMGILLSVPFVPPSDDAIRAMTATTSFLALLAGSAFINFENIHLATHPILSSKPSLNKTDYFSGFLIFLTIVGWIGVKGVWATPKPAISCSPNEQPVTMVMAGRSYVNVVKNDYQSMSIFPNIRRVDLQKNLSHFPNSGIWKILRKIEVGHTVILGLNFADEYAGSGLVWLVVSTNNIQDYHGVNYFCAKKINNAPLENGTFFMESGVTTVFDFP